MHKGLEVCLIMILEENEMERCFLINYLREHDQYSDKGAEVAADMFFQAHEQIQEAYISFIETGLLPETEIEGYTVEQLMTEHKMKPLAAFLTLDWLIRFPDEAKKSLAKGHDWVGTKPNG